jgi:hypothetical protein
MQSIDQMDLRHLPEITHQSIIKTTFLLYKTAGRATAVG